MLTPKEFDIVAKCKRVGILNKEIKIAKKDLKRIEKSLKKGKRTDIIVRTTKRDTEGVAYIRLAMSYYGWWVNFRSGFYASAMKTINTCSLEPK